VVDVITAVDADSLRFVNREQGTAFTVPCF
jgi:hypothetical protein